MRAGPSGVPALPRNFQGGSQARRAGIGNKALRQARPRSGRSGSGPGWSPSPGLQGPGHSQGVGTLSRDGRALFPKKELPSRARELATPDDARANSRIERADWPGELAANASPRPRAPRAHGGVANPGSPNSQRASPLPQSPSPPLQGPSSSRDYRASQSLARYPWISGDSPASSGNSRVLSRGRGRAPIVAGGRGAARFKAHGGA